MVNTSQQVARAQTDNRAVTASPQPLTDSPQDPIRSLGALEHLLWLYDQNRFVHFAVTALISGEASPRDWRRGLQKRHPNLSVCIAGEPGSVPSFRQADATPIPLLIVADEDRPEPRWEAEVGKQLATPFNPSQAPLIRAVLVQGTRHAAFMLVAHHSIADAFYAHMRPGSLKVKVGDKVVTGQVLGVLGNSGNTDAPHLHFHVMDGPSPLLSRAVMGKQTGRANNNRKAFHAYKDALLEPMDR
jgi:hypothetical protein